MKKIKYLFKSIKFSTFSSLFKVYKKVKKQTKKKFVLFDIIYCSIKYQAAFYDYLEFEFYSLNKEQRNTYLTNGKNNEIVRRFNDKSYWHIFDNKDEFNKKFEKYLKREYLNPNFSENEFIAFIKNKDKIIAKPVDGVGGHGITIYDTKEKNLYSKVEGFLLEEVIIQDEKLSRLYDKSVNTMRMFTFYDGKKAHLLQSILKLGNNGVIDNFSSGGMYGFLNEKGVVITPFIDKNDSIYGIHPISKEQLLGFQVPKFNEAVKLVLEAAKEIKEVKYIGWDVAISKDGPVIIEGNCYPGVFQIKPRFSKDKTGILPKYKKIMNIDL